MKTMCLKLGILLILIAALEVNVQTNLFTVKFQIFVSSFGIILFVWGCTQYIVEEIKKPKP